MSNTISRLRNQGVQATSTEDKRATPKTVRNMVPMEFFAFEFCNEKGEIVRTMVFKIGDTWWHDPEGVAWASRITEIAGDSWLGKALKNRVVGMKPISNDDVPKNDHVDIMGGGKRG